MTAVSGIYVGHIGATRPWAPLAILLLSGLVLVLLLRGTATRVAHRTWVNANPSADRDGSPPAKR